MQDQARSSPSPLALLSLHRHHSSSSTAQDGLQITLVVLRKRTCHLPGSSAPCGLFPLTLELFLHLASDTEI